ncbi:MAG: type II CAAX prenyl endopeptidase Rce1 family protein, partial [Candidatus Heimdallarchaeota archaeon]
RKRDRAIGFFILIILGIYIPLTFLLSSRFDLFLKLLRKSPFVRGIYLAPLGEEFTCRVLLPYAFLLTFARIPRFAKQEISGLPLPLVVSHFLSALIFSIAHYKVHIGPFFDFYLFFRLFSYGITFSCVFLIFFALTDSTTGYAGAVLAHQYLNWRLLALL